MNDPLVDAEGFPLNNIDIYQVRHARHRIICTKNINFLANILNYLFQGLQNDHKALMKQIENGLESYYNSNMMNGHSSINGITNGERLPIEIHQIPFARVTAISPNSPAELCVRFIFTDSYHRLYMEYF